MSFNFGGNTNLPKPIFGAPASSGFSFGSNTQPLATSNFGFGATSTTSTAPNFSFGSNFGNPISTSTGTNFGTSANTTGFSGFGTTTSAPTTGFNFGLNSLGSTTTASQTGFNFGTAPTTTVSTGFSGFGSSLSTQPTQGATGGFGNFGGFGGTTASTGSSLFGGLGTTTNTGTSTFGTGLSTFGAKPTGTAFNFGSTTGGLNSTFSTGSTFGSTLGQSQLQQPQQTASDPDQLIINSVLNVRIFGDERDNILAKWNLIQAAWGVGKGYYNQNQPPVEYKPDNPYCRFKAIVYSAIPDWENKDGRVTLFFNNTKKEADVKNHLSQIQTTISTTVLGNRPELKLSIEEVSTLGDETVQMIVYLEEKNNLGVMRKIPANELANFFNQTFQKNQLLNLGITKILPNVKPDSEQINEYLKKPPLGIDLRIWKQAQEDNPNADKFIPVPIIGFNQLKSRLQVQEAKTATHCAYLDKVNDDITALKQKQTASVAQIAEYKRKFSDLQHRVLKILVKQEMYRKVGMALQPEEEQLRIQLENMQAQISIPTQFRGRLTELLAHIRILRCSNEAIANNITTSVDRYTIGPGVQDDIKEFLCLEQVGINHLIDIIYNNQATLQKIKEGLQQILQS